TDEQRSQVLIDDRGQPMRRRRAADARLRFAPADQAGVRGDLDDDGIERCDPTEVADVLALVGNRNVDPGGLCAGDLHVPDPLTRSSSAGSPEMVVRCMSLL